MNASLNSRWTVVIIADAARPQTVVVTDAQTQRRMLQPGEQRLARGEVLSLERKDQTLRIVSGCAWITFDGQDVIVEAGQKIRLEPGVDVAAISALGDEPLVYRVYECS